MKLKSKTTATLLIAIFMISTFAFASASPGITLTTDGEGTAKIIPGGQSPSVNMVELTIPAYDPVEYAAGQYDQARVVFDYTGNLNSITGVSFQSYVIGGYNGRLHPFIVLAVDTGTDGNPDAWVVQCLFFPEGHEYELENAWQEIVFDGESPVHVAGDRTELTDGRYVPYTTLYNDDDTLDALKGESGWGTFTVLEVKVMIGEFPTDAMTAYVDDVTINDVLYDFDLESEGPVSMTVNTVAIVEEVRISVSPVEVDFGTIVEGEWAETQTINVENTGTVTVLVTTSMSGSDAAFYDANLDVTDLGTIDPGFIEDAFLDLFIPLGTEAGIKTATLIFWAEEA